MFRVCRSFVPFRSFAYQSELIHFGFNATSPNDNAASGKSFFDSSNAVGFERFFKDGAYCGSKQIDMRLSGSPNPIIISAAGDTD